MSVSLDEPEGLIKMNRVLFRRYVENRELSQPWIVAFTRNGSKKFNKCIPTLEQVAAKSYGYMFVGMVDRDQEPLLAKDYDVKKNWTVFLFNKNGHAQLPFPCDAQKYYRLLVDNLPNDVDDADPSWIESSKKKTSVILFTSRFKIPHMWRAIGGYFKTRGLRVGLCTEQEYINKFEIEKLPTVLYMNSSGHYKVQNAHDYKTLRNNLNDYFYNRPPHQKSTMQRFFLSDQFSQECTPGLICVFHSSKSIDPRFALKETRFSEDRLRFFSGFTNLPYKFMKEDEIYLFNGDRSGLISVDDIQELDEMIKFALKGTIKWTPIDEFLSEL